MSTPNIEVNNVVISFANVDKLSEMISSETWQAMAEVSEAKATIKRGAHWLLFRLMCDFGGGKDDASRAKGEEILKNFPRVGSKYKEGSNSVADLNPEPGVKKDGTATENYVSIYAKIWDVSDAGQKHHAEVKAWDEAKAEYQDTIAWDNEKNRLTQRRQNEINKFKESMKLLQKIEDIHDFITNANVFLALEGEGDTKRPTFGAKGVIIENTETRTQKAMSPGQVLALNVPKAVENGATLSALLATVGKGSKAPETFIKTIEKIDQWDEVTAEYGAYFESVANDTKKYQAMLKKLNEAGSDALLLTLDDIQTRINNIIGLPAFASRIEALGEAGMNATKARRALIEAKKQAA